MRKLEAKVLETARDLFGEARFDRVALKRARAQDGDPLGRFLLLKPRSAP